MKFFKKAAALLLAVMMIAGLALAASAAEPTGSITIKDSATVPVKGKTFDAYKVMDAVMKDPADASKGVTYTVPAEMKDFFADRYTISKDAADFDKQVVAKIAALESADPSAFARNLLAAAKAAKLKPVSKEAVGEATSVTIDNLPLGYYVIEDTAVTKPVSSVMLQTTGDVAVTLKADKASVKKEIVGSGENNNAAVGDKIPFQVTGTVPDMTGFTKYYYVVNDTMSKGLTFNDDVVVKVDNKPLTDTTDYTVSSYKNAAGETVIEIVFKDFVNKQNANQGKKIEITYSATVNENAVIGTAGNPNKVNLTYSNNPNKIPGPFPGKDDNPDTPGETPDPIPEDEDKPNPDDKDYNDGIAETPDSVTRTYVTGLEITKQDADGNSLAGAEFELSGTALNTVLVKKTEFKISADGTYYLLKNGQYTETKATEDTKDQYVSTTDKYAKSTKTEKIDKVSDVHYKGVTGADGILRFDGLAAGTYTLKELKAPAGFNKLDKDITFTVKCAYGKDSCTWSVENAQNGSFSAATGSLTTTIINVKGTILPSTGGMGTTIFYVMGTMLVMMSGVMLITRKRANNF